MWGWKFERLYLSKLDLLLQLPIYSNVESFCENFRCLLKISFLFLNLVHSFPTKISYCILTSYRDKRRKFIQNQYFLAFRVSFVDFGLEWMSIRSVSNPLCEENRFLRTIHLEFLLPWKGSLHFIICNMNITRLILFWRKLFAEPLAYIFVSYNRNSAGSRWINLMNRANFLRIQIGRTKFIFEKILLYRALEEEIHIYVRALWEMCHHP